MGSGRFAHQALLYETADQFVERVAAFLQGAITTAAPAMAVLDEDKHAPLQEALGTDASGVTYVDVRTVGRNPAHLTSLWHTFLDDGAGGPRWGVAEALWTGRSAAETAECHRYDALLHLTVAADGDFTLLCPFDVSALAPDAVADAVRIHPELYDTAPRANASYAEADPRELLAEPLLPPPEDADTFTFTDADLTGLRARVASTATDLGIGRQGVDDLVLAVDEVATNSYRYGGGGGVLRSWEWDGRAVFEVRDRGRFTDPLVGQLRPSSSQVGGRGLWIANQLCDLVQVRSTRDGAVVRLHARPA